MYKSWGLPVWGNKLYVPLGGGMNLTYMYAYMYVNKMPCGSAKGLKMATNFVNIDGHNFLILIDGSED